MNYLPFVSYGVYGAGTPRKAATFWVSWGLMEFLPGAVQSAVTIVMDYYRRLRL